MLGIIHASYLDDYRIALSFNNNKMGIANLKDLIFTDHRAPFLMLRNENEFKQFNIEHDTIVWKNGLDLAPEFLFFITFKESPEFQTQFQAWGYLWNTFEKSEFLWQENPTLKWLDFCF